jgi:hypothetical protein
VQPNPTNGPFTVSFTLKSPAYVTADIYNGMGQKIMGVYSGNMQPGFQQIQGNIAGIDNGIYFLRMVTNSADTIVRKLVKTTAY